MKFCAKSAAVRAAFIECLKDRIDECAGRLAANVTENLHERVDGEEIQIRRRILVKWIIHHTNCRLALPRLNFKTTHGERWFFESSPVIRARIRNGWHGRRGVLQLVRCAAFEAVAVMQPVAAFQEILGHEAIPKQRLWAAM